MSIPDDFFIRLVRLVAVDTVSPMSPAACSAIDDFLLPYAFSRLANKDLWVRDCKGSAVWVYCHVDTKPIGHLDSWKTAPLQLTKIGDRLFGRGVSDSKFQLLNALDAFADVPVNFLIDGAEEYSSLEAGHFLTSASCEVLIVVDGSSPTGTERYSGMNGQFDGHIRLQSGKAPMHSGRRVRGFTLDGLEQLSRETEGRHFNLTRIHGGDPERSLTLESFEVGFDLRFGPEETEWASHFVLRHQARLRQTFPPVCGSEPSTDPLAPFSNPLGQSLTGVRKVIVLPGGRADNAAHCPNEHVSLEQIPLHRELLKDTALTLMEKH